MGIYGLTEGLKPTAYNTGLAELAVRTSPDVYPNQLPYNTNVLTFQPLYASVNPDMQAVHQQDAAYSYTTLVPNTVEMASYIQMRSHIEQAYVDTFPSYDNPSYQASHVVVSTAGYVKLNQMNAADSNNPQPYATGFVASAGEMYGHSGRL
jgi:hypothetical protein